VEDVLPVRREQRGTLPHALELGFGCQRRSGAGESDDLVADCP
jgi:hypothetical protein